VPAEIPVGRLTRRPEFLAVAATRSKGVAHGLIVQARRREDDALRVGFTVTKKIGNAVTRNRAKRRLRALARQVLPATALPGHDLVLVARAETPTRDFALLEADLRHALKRAGASRETGRDAGRETH
jgi:ribonuclease P protein component